jgi:hypothetical protein
MPEPTLAELNAHLFASLMHKPRQAASSKNTKGAKKAPEPVDKPTFTAVEIAACTAAGVELAALVTASNLSK